MKRLINRMQNVNTTRGSPGEVPVKTGNKVALKSVQSRFKVAHERRKDGRET